MSGSKQNMNLLIKNGTIIDGTGKKKYKADLRIRDNKIVEIGKLKENNRERVISARGQYVVPGFVDILNHSDAFLTIFENPQQESLLRQGITTALMGNCGSSLAPLTDGIFINSIQKWGDISKINVNWLQVGEYLDELERRELGINIATLIGHSTIRRSLIKDESRELTKIELQKMAYLIEQGIQQGAFGVSTGLAYAHARHTTRKELKIILKIVKQYGGLYSTHIRNESENFLNSVKEALDIAKEMGVNLEFSHLKIVGEKSWNQFDESLLLIGKQKNINFDIYPYTTTASVLYTFLPAWATEGGNKNIFKNIKDGKSRKKLIKEMQKDNYDYSDMTIAMGSIDDTYFGKTISEIAQNQNVSAEEATLNLIIASNNRIIVFYQSISKQNLKKAIKHPRSIISTDGAGFAQKHALRGEVVHPRYFGAMPKYLGEYVQRDKILTWEDGIKKITSAPAEKIGIKNRGKIEKNYFADIVILDPEIIQSLATFSNPYQYPKGIKYVIVNGQVAVEKTKLITKAGRVLRRI